MITISSRARSRLQAIPAATRRVETSSQPYRPRLNRPSSRHRSANRGFACRGARAAPQHADHDALDQQCFVLEIDTDGLKVGIFGHQPDHAALLSIAFDRYFVLEPRDDDLTMTQDRKSTRLNSSHRC